MDFNIPSPNVVAERLQALGHADLKDLAARSGVPFTTLWKIRSGQTKNPRLQTIRQLGLILFGSVEPADRREFTGVGAEARETAIGAVVIDKREA